MEDILFFALFLLVFFGVEAFVPYVEPTFEKVVRRHHLLLP